MGLEDGPEYFYYSVDEHKPHLNYPPYTNNSGPPLGSAHSGIFVVEVFTTQGFLEQHTNSEGISEAC